MPNDTMNFGVDLLPITTNAYNLGSADKKWNIFGNLTGNATNVTGVVSVENGGTGRDSLTANALLIGNGTSGILTKNLFVETDKSVDAICYKVKSFNLSGTSTSGVARIILRMKDTNDTSFFHAGLYGKVSEFSYMFIGSNTYNSANNFRIYSDGSIYASGIKSYGISDTELDSKSGSYFFASSSTFAIDDITTNQIDWVGLQAGGTKDKWQLTAVGNKLWFRQNESGGENTTNWNNWVQILDTNSYADSLDSNYYTLDGSNVGTKLQISTQSAAYTNGIQFINSTTKKGSIGTDNNGVIGIYGTKIALRPELDAATQGVEITTTAMYPTASITLGTTSNKWSTVYATTFDGTATKATADADGNTITTTYLPRSGGQMTGTLTWANSTALPSSTSLSYFLGIDAFTDGGTTKYITAANLRTSISAAPAAGSTDITTLGTITTGTWNGDTIAVANGGTGGTTAIAARANLGIGNGKVFYGTCTSNASATTKQVECDEFDPETDFNEGTMVSVLFTVKNTGAVGSLKLSVGNVIKGYTTAAAIKKIYYTNGVSNLTSAAEIPAGGVVTFIYSGTYWQVVGLDYNTNTNTAVTQSITSSTESQYPILLSHYAVGTATTTATSVQRNDSIYAIPGNGELYATSFHGTLIGNTDWANINNRPIGGTTAYLNENNATGYIKVKINAKQQWMMAFTLRVHQNYKIRDFHINGYNYGTRHWYSQKVSCLINDGGTSIPNVIFGYDDDAENDYNTLWVAIPSEAYEGAEIVNVVSHWGLADATSKFEIIYESTLTGITQATQTPFTYVNGKQGVCYGAYSGDPANFHLRSGLTIREADLAGATQSNMACAPRLSFYWDGYGVATHLTMYNDGEMYLNKLDGSNVTQGNFHASKVYGAVWNDYAEYRTTNENVRPGQVVIDNDDGSLSITEDYLLPGAQVVSDTYGFAIGETETAKTPLAVSGRVLVYTYKNREEYHAGQAVCSAPGGTVTTMTREEIQKYPDAIIGIVSEIPDYETWGSDNILVDNRIWIKVR